MIKVIKDFLNQNKLLFQNIAKNFAMGLTLGLAVLAISALIAQILYQPKKMVKRGFEVAIKAEGVEVKKVEKIDIATLIKNADIDAGAKVFKKCASCHTVNQGGANKVGPNLYAIVGKKRAAVSGFSYSQALQSKGGTWTIDDLNNWLTKPKDFAPGTKMAFAGLKKDKDRANVIAYLKSVK